jgi:hypothetical protein
MPFPEASHSNTNVFVKSGRARTRVVHMVCLQSLKSLSNCWGPSKRVLFKESRERCCNLSIVLDELAIIPCEAQKSMQSFESLRVRTILHSFNLFWVHPDAIPCPRDDPSILLQMHQKHIWTVSGKAGAERVG